MTDGGKYSKGNEKYIVGMRDILITVALSEGKHVIVDDTNIHPVHEETIRGIIKDFNSKNDDNVTFEVKVFDTDVDECIERDKKRENSVGADVIVKMAKQWHPVDHGADIPEIDPALFGNGKLWVVIYDLDGTASIMGQRSPYDSSKCDELDRVNIPLRDILQKMEKCSEYHFVAMSGRSSDYQEPTIRFLRKHDFPYDALYMRKSGDNRKDDVIKGEMYEEHIKGKYNVLVVFDDRNQMIDYWRKTAKVPCFQVNYGDF